jgi:hypothetical protein
LKDICRQNGFLTVAFSADGDNMYEEFLSPICQTILSDEWHKMTFEEIVGEVGEMDFPFVTDLLHFVKCLRNRIANHPLSLHWSLPPMMADEIEELLDVGDCLKPKSNGSQLKDATTIRVFALETLVILLMNTRVYEALYFLPIVLSRLANQILI